MIPEIRSGMVAMIGRPNVGKSSLINAMVGEKISIVTRKPQTTRHQIQGVLNRPGMQLVFVDTPGLHLRQNKALNRLLNQYAASAIHDVELVVMVVEAGKFTDEDAAVLKRIKERSGPVGLVINKVDKLADKDALLPELQKLAAMHEFVFVIPTSARKGANLDALVKELAAQMPDGPPLYPEEQIRGYDLNFHVAEVVREKLFTRLSEELPYALTVEPEKIEEEGRLLRISAVIWVERPGQKRIVIGDGGSVLKQVGTEARKELEAQTGRKVFLKLWVRVKENWSDDPKALRGLGFEEY